MDNITISSNKLARTQYKPYLRVRQPRCNKHICLLTGGAEGVRAVMVEVGEERGGTGVVFLHHCRACEVGLFVSQLAKTMPESVNTCIPCFLAYAKSCFVIIEQLCSRMKVHK